MVRKVALCRKTARFRSGRSRSRRAGGAMAYQSQMSWHPVAGLPNGQPDSHNPLLRHYVTTSATAADLDASLKPPVYCHV